MGTFEHVFHNFDEITLCKLPNRQTFECCAMIRPISRLLLDARASRVRETLTPRKGYSMNIHLFAYNQAKGRVLLISNLELIAQTASI